MLFPRGPLFDPRAEEGGLAGVQTFAAGRHATTGVGGFDAGDEFTGVGVAGDHGPAAGLEKGEESFGCIEAQAGLAGLVVGAVALDAVVREDRANVPIEVDGGFIGLRARAGGGTKPQCDGNEQGRCYAEPEPEAGEGHGDRILERQSWLQAVRLR